MATITVKNPKAGREVQFDVDYGGTLEESVEKYGEKIVHGLFLSQCVIRAAGSVRPKLGTRNEAGEFQYTDEQCIEFGKSYVPKLVTINKKDPLEAITKMVAQGKMTQADLIKAIKKRFKEDGIEE